MKFKREIITIIIVILVFLSISTINASDNDENAIGVTDESIESITDDCSLQKETNAEILSDSEIGTFTELDAKINEAENESTVILEKDYEFNEGTDSDSEDLNYYGIIINKNLTIDGRGHKIDAISKNAIFFVECDGVIIKNLIFMNANSDYGGAIYSKGSISVINCTFDNNKVSGYGGAVYLCKNPSNIINCIFTNNSASSNGGAIYSVPENVQIINSTFINNSASSNGGAIYSYAKYNLGNCVNSTFINNYAHFGGAIYNYAFAGGFDRCIFMNNSADSYPDIYGASKIINSIFLNPKFLSYEGDVIHKGWSQSIIITNCWFGNTRENPSKNPLSFINLLNWYYLDLEINKTTNHAKLSLKLYDNTTGQYSIDENYNLPNITFNLIQENFIIDNTEVYLNQSGQYDFNYTFNSDYGVITAQYGSAKVSEVFTIGDFNILQKLIDEANDNDVIVLNRNYAYDIGIDTIEGGIEINKNGLTIDGNGYTIDAKGQSSIFYTKEGVSNVIIKNLNLINGNSRYGSAIYIYDKSNYCSIINCNVSNNIETDPSDWGGAIFVMGDYCTIDNCNFINNTALGVGGAIYYRHDNYAYIKNSNFINNTAINGNSYNEGGGAIYVGYGNVEIDKSSFINNNAKDLFGSVLYVYYKYSVSMNNSILINNNGWLDVYGGSSTTVNNCWFGNTNEDYEMISENNVFSAIQKNSWYYLDIDSTMDNHAIISLKLYDPVTQTTINKNYNLPEITFKLFKQDIDFDESEIELNQTGQYDIHYVQSSRAGIITVQYEDLKFKKTIYAGDFNKLQQLVSDANENSVIELNRNYTYSDFDDMVDGIYINKKGLTIDGKGYTIDAKGKSRIFNIDSSDVTIKNINLINGYYNGNAGILNNNGKGTSLYNCTFINGSASNGGAVYSDGSNLNIVDCTFINGSASNDGGAIKSYWGVNLNIINSTFISNIANYGGVIYRYDANSLIYNCTFIKNSITNSQQIILDYGNNFTIDKSLFIENDAKNGQLVRLNNDGVISNSIFLNNNGNLFTNSFKADYNWFGNVDHDKNYKQPNFGIAVNNWLFVNGSYDNEMNFKDIVTVKFIFKVYENGNIYDYDSSKVHEVALALSSDKGILDKYSAVMDEEFTFTANDVGNGRVSANFFNKLINRWVDIGILINKCPTEIIADEEVISLNYNDSNKKIEGIGLNPEIDGFSLKYQSNDTNIVTVDDDGKITVIGAGTALINVKFEGNDYYSSCDKNITVIINKIDSRINFSNDIVFDYLSSNSTTLILDGCGVDLENISVIGYDACINYADNVITVSGLNAGNYTLKVSTTPDNNHNSVEGNVKITVNKISPTITIEPIESVNVSQSVDIIANVNSNAELSYLINDSSIVAVNGNRIAGIKGGKVNITVKAGETENYLGGSENIILTVNKISPNLKADSLEVEYDHNGLIKPAYEGNGTLTYRIDNEDIASVSDNGEIKAIRIGQTNITLTVSETDKYLEESIQVILNIIKTSPNLTVDEINILAGNTGHITPNYNGNGDLSYESQNPEIVTVSEDALVKGISQGTTIIKITISESENYTSQSIDVPVTVKNKEKGNIIIDEDQEVSVYVNNNITIKANSNNDGILTYEINNTEVANLTGNQLTGLMGGKVKITIKLQETHNYTGDIKELEITVNKLSSLINILNEDLSLNLFENLTLNIQNKDNSLYFESLNPEIATVDEKGIIYGLGVGKAEIKISAHETDKYLENTTFVTVTVNKLTPVIEIEVSNITVGETENIFIIIPDGGKINFTILKNSQTIYSVNKTLNNYYKHVNETLTEGNYTILVKYFETDKYNESTLFKEFIVKTNSKSNVSAEDINIDVKLPVGDKSPEININLPDNATGYLLVNVNGYDYYVNLKNGSANIKLPELSYGNHNIAVNYSGDVNYNPISKNINIHIPKPKLAAKNISIRYSNKYSYKVHVTVDGKAVVKQYVTFKFNGKSYKSLTDSKGYAILKLPVVKPKNYKITVSYNDISVSKTVKVKNIIVAKNKKVKKSVKTLKIKVKLKKVNKKYLKGKKLTLKIKGKIFKAKTNNKGVAIFKIKKNVVKKLKRGKKYNYKVTFGKDVVTKKLFIKR